MLNFTRKSYLTFILILSLTSMGFAYFVEYVLGYQPCNLCLIQRVPYGLSIILIVLNFLLKKNSKFIVLLLMLTFVFSLMISFYHFGIEQGFFNESTLCGVKNPTEVISKEQLLEQLQEKTISCKDVTFKIFGLSLSSINIFISFIFLIILTKIFISYEKHKL